MPFTGALTEPVKVQIFDDDTVDSELEESFFVYLDNTPGVTTQIRPVTEPVKLVIRDNDRKWLISPPHFCEVNRLVSIQILYLPTPLYYVQVKPLQLCISCLERRDLRVYFCCLAFNFKSHLEVFGWCLLNRTENYIFFSDATFGLERASCNVLEGTTTLTVCVVLKDMKENCPVEFAFDLKLNATGKDCASVPQPWHRLSRSLYVDGTATRMDHDAMATDITFEECQRRECTNITIYDDMSLEREETFFITLTKPSTLDNRIRIDGSQKTVKIRDDDCKALVSRVILNSNTFFLQLSPLLLTILEYSLSPIQPKFVCWSRESPTAPAPH